MSSGDKLACTRNPDLSLPVLGRALKELGLTLITHVASQLEFCTLLAASEDARCWPSHKVVWQKP